MRYNTARRDEIIGFLSERSDCSFTLEQICDSLLEEGRGKSTVYRIVSELVDGGIIRRLSDGHTRRVTYQYVGDEHCAHHLHLKCKECGRLAHLDTEVSEELCEAVRRAGGFVIDGGEMLLGVCEDCGGRK